MTVRFSLWAAFLACAPAWGGEPLYELSGSILPPSRAAISLWGSTTSFGSSTASDPAGRFKFAKLRPGTYTIGVFVKGRGEVRRTVEVGPGTAQRGRRVTLTLQLREADFQAESLRRTHVAPASQLAVPEAAQREMREALKDISRHRTEDAVRRLERAVEIAPGYSAAWNDLGTIAYRGRDFRRAEECFRKALAGDPSSFEPMVNLGGVLVTLGRPDEALEHNLGAVLRRPNDALANSQLGMTYFQLGKLDLARKYLEAARRIDPAHFSHPQVLLAEVLMRERKPVEAAGVLEEFLRHHPDYPQAEKMRAAIERLRR